ncbi:hypothetical protein KSW81_006204 [Nannochloris sp. 'desiccata']|nr:hypothetical protein KSW81_006204 [Chlorella desiccata (nom. nud.)]
MSMQKLLQQVKKDRELAQDVICEGPPPILYLDCRGKDISSPQQFANVIRELVAEDAALKNWLQAIKLNFPGTELDFENMFKPAADKARMASIIASLTKFLEAVRPQDGLHPNNFVARDIGNLATSDEAKKFVKYRKDCGDAPPDFFDTTKDGKKIDMWPRVYEVCGGNIGLLERCAGYAKDLGSWEEGLKEVSMGLEVSFEKLEDAMGENALSSMVEWNLVALRRKSSWAKDLPVTVFAALNDVMLVTMPSPVDLYFVLKMYETGELDASSTDEKQ